MVPEGSLRRRRRVRVSFPIIAGAFGEVNEDASKLITNLARLTAQTDRLWEVDVPTSQPQQERRCLPDHAVTVQARPRLPNSQGTGTAPPQTEALRPTLRTGGRPIKQRTTITADHIDPDQKPACLAMLGGGRTLSPRDMVCTNSGATVKTLALSRSQSPSVVRLVQ